MTLADEDIDLAVEAAYLTLPERERPHLGGAPLWRAIYRASYAAGRAEAIAEAARVCETMDKYLLDDDEGWKPSHFADAIRKLA